MSDNDSHNSQSDFGANEWLVAEMYGQWLVNPDSVDKSWWQILERYHLTQGDLQAVTPAIPTGDLDYVEPVTGSITIIDTDSTVVQAFDADAPAPPTEAITIPIAKTTDKAPKAAPVPADLPVTGAIPIATEHPAMIPR